MSENSKIEWTDHTFNPWIGCHKVSPGCANCYAETLMDTRYGRVKWGKGQPRSRTSEANWKLPLKWHRDFERALETWKVGVSAGADMGPMPLRPRVFCASLADWLDDEVPVEWLADLLELISQTHHLDWLLLTKRPENFFLRVGMVARRSQKGLAWEWAMRSIAPPYVWLGTTVEDQERADERIPHLLKIPAAMRFLSCEPLLGPVDLGRLLYRDWFGIPPEMRGPIPTGIHWCIVGGESGKHARPMRLDWARSLRDQCQSATVPFFFKQWGEWSPVAPEDDDHAADMCKWVTPNGDTTEHGDPSEDEPMFRVGKKAAGRLLEGREHNEIPTYK